MSISDALALVSFSSSTGSFLSFSLDLGSVDPGVVVDMPEVDEELKLLVSLQEVLRSASEDDPHD